MGAIIELANQNREKIVFGLDSTIIQKYISGIKGGRSLDVPDTFPLDVIHAGHVIITDGNGTYKPMPITKKTGTTALVYTEVDVDDLYEEVDSPDVSYIGNYYEKSGSGYEKTSDVSIDNSKTYYTAKSPKALDLYEKSGEDYVATNDTTPQSKTYYAQSGGDSYDVTDADGNQVYVYGSLPDGYSYAGVLYRSVKKSKPLASIMTNGEVNSEALVVAIDDIKSAFLSACPHIVFIKDEAEEE